MLEDMLAHCEHQIKADYPLWISALLAGFIGSISHCSMMCSPIVAAQMVDMRRRKQRAYGIIWYHFGRITTYAGLGITVHITGKQVLPDHVASISSVLLVLAGVLFILSAFIPQKTHGCCGKSPRRLFSYIDRYTTGATQIFLRGLFMGFLPCGMLLSMVLLASSASHALTAAAVMMLFGITTIPALQAVGLTVLSLGKRYPTISFTLGRTVLAVNGGVLCALGFEWLHLH